VDDKKGLADMSLQEAAINLLATGYSVREAATILRVEPSTIRHWWGADPQFRPTVDALRQQTEPQPALNDGKKRDAVTR
jgi:transposase